MTRAEAKVAGLIFYDNGRKCPLNHESSVRYCISGKCLECCKAERVRFKAQRRAESAERAAALPPKPVDTVRKHAKAAGLLFYDNGSRCPRDHESTVRYTVTGKCLECSKGEGSRYQTGRAAYYTTHATYIKMKTKAWKDANPKKLKQLTAEYRQRHRMKLRAKNVIYRLTHTTPLLDRRVREGVRRTRKANAGGSFTPADVKRLFFLQRGKCAYCRVSLKLGYQIDHITPIRLGGHSNPSNLQLLCAPCNWSKQGKHPIDYAQGLGLLI